MKLLQKSKIILLFIFVTVSAFGQTTPLDSVITWGGDVERIRDAFNVETSALDNYFEDDYYIYIYYDKSNGVIHGIAMGDFKSKRKVIQFDITQNGIAVYPITSKRALKNYLNLIDIFETSVADLMAQNRPGFNVHVNKFKDTTKWIYLSYTVKNRQPVLKYQFLSSQQDYSVYLMYEKFPNLIEKLTFCGIVLTDPIIHAEK